MAASVDRNLTNSTISAGQALPAGSTAGNQPIDTYGIVAQSIGGGGGNGGAATADDVATEVPTGEGVSLALTASVGVGGIGRPGGNPARPLRSTSTDNTSVDHRRPGLARPHRPVDRRRRRQWRQFLRPLGDAWGPRIQYLIAAAAGRRLRAAPAGSWEPVTVHAGRRHQ